MADRLMVVIPCYNEEEVLPETSRRLREKMAALKEKGLISEDSRVLLVDDGSRDRTWELISALQAGTMPPSTGPVRSGLVPISLAPPSTSCTARSIFSKL